MSHSLKTRSPRRAALVALTLLASLLSCGREITGPGGAGAVAQLKFTPDYSSMIDEVDGVMHSVAALLPFNRVRIELRRADSSIAASQVVPFPETATEVPLSITVQLSSGADASGEILTAFLRYINAAGDTVFAGGPLTVRAVPGSGGTSQQPVEIPILPTAPGAVFTRLDISPDSAAGNSGATLTFTATGYDAQNAVVPNAIFGFISRNPSIAAVPTLGQGAVNLVAVRGETWIVAQSLTGLKDSARVRVIPIPTQISKVSGDVQTALQSAAFAQALRVRVLAADNLAVAGSTVNFVVTAGGGTLSAASVQTDINGFADVIWTAGTSIGQGTVTATVGSTAITAAFTGNQVNAGPTSLAFESQPLTIVSGDTLPPIRVAVRNALGQTITAFTGSVSLTRVGTGGGRLVGDTAALAVAGVATFRGLTVDRAGTDYRLSAVLAGVPNQLSNIFVVTPAPATSLVLVSGGGQITNPSTALPAPIVVRVTNVFGQPIVGATVTFAVTGGGSVNPSTPLTDASGLASTQWTLGASGVQQLSVTVGTLSALNVTAALTAPGGPPELFAGYDSTRIRIGQARSVPIYLSNRADTAITVTLSTSAAALQWASSTVQFPAQTRQVNVNLAAGLSLVPGTYWAIVASAAGNDSIEISVDSAFVQFADPYMSYVSPRDTVHLPVRLSDPAPAGGVTVRVKSLNPRLAQVIAGTGARAPVPSCLDAEYCYYGNIPNIPDCPDADFIYGSLQETIGAPGDSVEIVIPAGELVGHFAFIVKDTTARTSLNFVATAPTYMASSVSFFLERYILGVDLRGSGRVGVGEVIEGTVDLLDGGRQREVQVRLRSLTPSIFDVDSIAVLRRLDYSSTYFDLRGLSAGLGQLEYGNAEIGYDTIAVPVLASRLHIAGELEGTLQSERIVYLGVGPDSAAGYSRTISDLPITLVSRSPNVVQIERAIITLPAGYPQTGVPVRVTGFGTSWLVATAPGYPPDSVLFRGQPRWVEVRADNGFHYLGVGTSLRFTARFYDQTGNFGIGRVIEARPRNAARARVVTPFASMTEANAGIAQFDVVGLSVGEDTLDVFFADSVVGSAVYIVDSASVLLNTTAAQANALEPDSTFTYLVGGILVSSFADRMRPAADTVRAILRSSDPSIVRVVDSTVTFLPGQDLSAATASGSYVALRPGTSTLTLSAPGFIAGTSLHTVQPYSLDVLGGGAGYEAGIGSLHSVTLRRNSSVTDTLRLTITHQGPGRMDFVRPVTGIPAENEYFIGEFTGVTLGLDTVIFSAANHTPDTLFVQVFPSVPQLMPDTYVYSGEVDSSVTTYFQVSRWNVALPSQTRRFRVTSLDTTKARVIQDTIVVGVTGSIRNAAVRYRNTGTVTLVMTDLDGISAPDSVNVQIFPRQLYGWTDYGEFYLPIGMRQRTYDENLYLEIDFETDKDLWVRLTTSKAGLISLPDSVRIPAGEGYAYFNIAAGDTVGGVRVTASLPGFNSWEFDVLVSRTLLLVYPDDGAVGGTGFVYVETVDALEQYSRPLAVATNVRLTSNRPDIASVIMPELTIPADSEYVYAPALRAHAPGTALIRATDARVNAFSAFEPDTYEFYVYGPRIFSYGSQYLASPSLLTTSAYHGLSVSQIRDSVWVRLTSKQGRFRPSADSILVDFLDYSNSPYFGLRGISAGIDTLVFSAAGFPSTESLVRIEPGMLLLEPGTPTVVTMGDSTLVRVNFGATDGVPGATVSTPITLNYGYRSGSTQQILIPAGATSASFWVRPSAPGIGTFEVSASGFVPLRVTLDARSRP